MNHLLMHVFGLLIWDKLYKELEMKITIENQKIKNNKISPDRMHDELSPKSTKNQFNDLKLMKTNQNKNQKYYHASIQAVTT